MENQGCGFKASDACIPTQGGEESGGGAWVTAWVDIFSLDEY